LPATEAAARGGATRAARWALSAFAVASLALLLGAAANPGGFQWGLPHWVPPPVEAPDNPMTASKVELGRHLFYDTRLSANGQMSCATCHDQAKAFTDGRAFSVGVTGERGDRSSMSLVNLAWMPVLTWQNPQLTQLEIQALIPLFGEHPVEMGMSGREAELFALFRKDATYQRLFKAAFAAEAAQGGDALYSLSTLTKALAAFQRSIVSFDSPYDRYRYGGQPNAISAAAKRGESLFFSERLECYHCHGGFAFTDNLKHKRLAFPELGFHNTGLYNTDGFGSYPERSPGVVEFTGDKQDKGRFRTPTLRNVAVTAPYMHDGSIASLADVLRSHYAKQGRAATGPNGPNPKRSEFIVGFEISEAEIADVVAFLESLTDPTLLTNPRYSNPWSAKR
jgi:cytochrome c peroxidase